MIKATLVLDPEGHPLSFDAEGHSAEGKPGSNLVCAAFSILARGAFESLEGLPGMLLEGSAPERGSLRFVVRHLPSEAGERAAGIALFLRAGISSLEREYPGEVGLTVKCHWRE